MPLVGSATTGTISRPRRASEAFLPNEPISLAAAQAAVRHRKGRNLYLKEEPGLPSPRAGAKGRAMVRRHFAPETVAQQYDALLSDLARMRGAQRV